MLNFCSSRYGLVAPCLTLGFSTVFLASKPVCVRAITLEEKAMLDKLKFDVKKFVAEEKNYHFFENDLEFILYSPFLALKEVKDEATKHVGNPSRVYSDEDEFKKVWIEWIEYIDRIKTFLAKNPEAEKFFEISKNEKTGEIVDIKTDVGLLGEYADFFHKKNVNSFFDFASGFRDFFDGLGTKMKKQVLKERFCAEVKQALKLLSDVHFHFLLGPGLNGNFYEESLRKLGSFFETIEKILEWDDLTGKSCRLISEKSI